MGNDPFGDIARHGRLGTDSFDAADDARRTPGRRIGRYVRPTQNSDDWPFTGNFLRIRVGVVILSGIDDTLAAVGYVLADRRRRISIRTGLAGIDWRTCRTRIIAESDRSGIDRI